MTKALVLAGGGLKVAYQAGALQVWLDEAGLEFELADGSSAGAFNLAMWCQGQSGREIADNWRCLSPLRYLWPTFARFRRNVYPDWGLNFAAIRRSARRGTFNAYDFTGQRLDVRPQTGLTPRRLDACAALPMWFPAVRIEGRTYVDAVFVMDANLEAAISAGADELWVIWTVSTKGRWRHGPVSKFFQIVEESANGTLRRTLDRIDASNAAIARGAPGEFGRPIAVRLLEGDVPIHYLLVFSRRAFARAVELGVEEARCWCRKQDVLLGQPAGPPRRPLRLRFGETMTGSVASAGNWESRLKLALGVRITDLDAFLADPGHRAELSGTADCDPLGGELPVERGSVQLFVDRKMTYRVDLHDAGDHPLTIVGEKLLGSGRGPFNAWRDATTLHVGVLQGNVELAAGTLRLRPLAFLGELASFSGPLRARLRFFRFFVGGLWRIYR